MRNLFFIIMGILLSAIGDCGGGGGTTNTITTIPNSQISVAATPNRNDYPDTNTKDGNVNTFMTTNTLNINDVVTVVYNLGAKVNLSSIEMWENYTGIYAMGDMVLSVSEDQTSWTQVTQMNASSNAFSGGYASVSVNINNVQYVRVVMTYTGTGAYGGTPAFYLSEIKFKKIN